MKVKHNENCDKVRK